MFIYFYLNYFKVTLYFIVFFVFIIYYSSIFIKKLIYPLFKLPSYYIILFSLNLLKKKKK